MEMNWENMRIYANDYLQKQRFTGNGMAVLQILENSQESNRSGLQLQGLQY